MQGLYLGGGKVRITGKQALVLFQILSESLYIKSYIAGYSISTRRELIDQIINQQSNKIIDFRGDE